MADRLAIPTGYEAAQAAAATRRKIAEMMLEKGLNPQQGMTSWAQVLGSLAQEFVGSRLESRANKDDAAISGKMVADFGDAMSKFKADSSTMSPQDLLQKYATNPWISASGMLDPYKETTTAMLKAANAAPSPTDAVIEVPDGAGGKKWVVNPVRRTAALEAQGYGLGPATESMPAPGGVASPGAMPPVPGGVSMTGTALPPLSGAAPGDGLALSLLSPDEKAILQQELQRRAAGNSAFTPPNAHMPMGSPLAAQRAPAGIVNGKPYWLINGQPYDNPEGK